LEVIDQVRDSRSNSTLPSEPPVPGTIRGRGLVLLDRYLRSTFAPIDRSQASASSMRSSSMW
jgi:hypothetical protein